jgi:hypothetical protein
MPNPLLLSQKDKPQIQKNPFCKVGNAHPTILNVVLIGGFGIVIGN